MITPAIMRTRTRSELAAMLADARTFDPNQVAGWVYRGTSLGLPALLERLTWIKFAKAFRRDHDRVRGWNIRIEQDALDLPWRPKLRHGRTITFGRFDVITDLGGIVLDYRADGGALRILRDPVVALDDRADTLLGRSLLAVGSRMVGTPSYFLLERDNRLDPL